MLKGKSVLICLAVIVILSGLLHFYRLGYPAQPVWDEVHFATYASDYVKGEAFLDIHPPLGKLIYAAVLELSGKPIHNPDFITSKYAHGDIVYDTNNAQLPYGDFPYVWLRALSALFGVLLPLAFYFFLRNVGVGKIGALLAAFFIILENSLLTETRLILLNGMLLVFGLMALAFFFDKRKFSPVFAGILFGLALSIKLTAIVFIGPAAIAYFLFVDKKRILKNLAWFFGLGFLIYFMFVIVGSSMFNLNQRIDALKNVGLSDQKLMDPKTNQFAKLLTVTIAENAFSVENYVIGKIQPGESSWYLWPFMEKTMVYFTDKSTTIVLIGNAFVWYLSTLAVMIASFILVRNLKKRPWLWETADKPLIILLIGYFSNLLPFFTIVGRGAYLYHYFPSLIFSIGLAGYLLSKFFLFEETKNANNKQIAALVLVILFAFGGFIYAARFVYGL